MNGKARLAWLGLAALVFFLALEAAPQKGGGTSVALKPDLRVIGVQAERVGFAADGTHQLRIRVTVVNSAGGTVCAGPFTVMVAKNDLRSEWFTFLGRRDAARLCTDPSRARAATAVLDFTDTVPVGEQRRYMATADEGNRVDEAKEDNNIGRSEAYVAKSFCPGVDLAMTAVDLVRGSDGGVFIYAHGRNRCSGSCAGGVRFTFSVAAPGTDWLPAVQPIAVPVVGLQEFATGGVGVYSRADRSVTYRVRIDPDSGACADTDPGNNECLVTLAAAEARKTHTCP